MTKKRKPEALMTADGAWLVKHTHDIDLAAQLVRAAIVEGYYADCGAVYLRKPDAGQGRAIWCWIGGPLPGSLAQAEGWAWQYHYADAPRRGVFPAVEFAP